MDAPDRNYRLAFQYASISGILRASDPVIPSRRLSNTMSSSMRTPMPLFLKTPPHGSMIFVIRVFGKLSSGSGRM